MLIPNTMNVYNSFYRHPTNIQLFKLIKVYTSSDPVEDGFEKVVIGRDWEQVVIPRTPDTEIVYVDEEISSDPLIDNFETFFNQGVVLEQKQALEDKLMEAKVIRWNLVERYVIEHKGFNNLASERNTSLQLVTKDEVLAGEQVSWMNLDSVYIPITEDNKQDFVDFAKKSKRFTQASFDALDDVSVVIKATPLDQIANINIVELWKEKWGPRKDAWKSQWI